MHWLDSMNTTTKHGLLHGELITEAIRRLMIGNTTLMISSWLRHQ